MLSSQATTPAGSPSQPAAIGRPPMTAISQPTIEIVMDGCIRFRAPASKLTQMQFDLALPAVKNDPASASYIVEDASRAGKLGLLAIQNTLGQSPGLQVRDGKIGLSYAVIEGKLQYMFQVCVRTK